MSRLLRTLVSVPLILLLLIQLCPAEIIVSAHDSIASASDAVVAPNESDTDSISTSNTIEVNDDTILCEIEERREESVKHFKLIDGSSVATVYDIPVHMQDENGNWTEIDNAISDSSDEDGEAVLSERGNSIKFAKKAKEGKLLTIKTNSGNIKWSLNGIADKVNAQYSDLENEDKQTKLAAKSVSGTIRYNEVMPGVSLEYQLSGYDIKENIILASSAAAQSLSFTLDIGNMTAALENNCVVIRDSVNEVVRIISAPYMVDANDEISTDIAVSLTADKKSYTVTIAPDMQWLLDESRVYPVIIDPTIKKSYSSSTVNNTSVYSSSPTSDQMYQYGCLYVGRESSAYGNLRGAFKFALPTGITESDMIINAYIKLTQHNHFGSGAVVVNAHQITSNLALSSLTWNKLNGKYSSIVLDSQSASSSTIGSNFYWDITTAVKSWYLEGNNYGLALVSTNEGSTYKYATFYTARYTGVSTSKYPVASISYLNHDGIEDYLSYHYAGSDTMGSIAVGDFNGNLIYAYTDLDMTGGYMPVTVEHIYNHSQRDKAALAGESMNFGYGMRLNLSQRIETSSITNYPYKYTDADGTVHYFTLKSGTSGAVGSIYEKEYDTTTLLSITSDGFKLESNDLVEYQFNSSGYLTSITNTSNGKTMTLSYTDGKLVSVTDGIGRITALTYDANNYLTAIIDPSGRSTIYSYENGCLSQITNPDATAVRLSYTADGNVYMLTQIEDIDSSKLLIEYYTESPRRVKMLTEYGSQGTEGNRLTWTYTGGETTVTDRSGKSETMMFDNFGHTVCIRDGEGNAVYGKYANTDDDNKHSLQYQSNMQSSVKNYLTNHGFESGTSGWMTFGTGTGNIQNVPTGGYLDARTVVVSNSQSTEYGMYQEVTVPDVAGKTLTFSAYLLENGFYPLPQTDQTGMYIGIQYQNADSEWVSTSVGPFRNTSWERKSCTATIPEDVASNTIRVFTCSRDTAGAYFIDNVQLEEGVVANRYNILENGHFTDSTGTTIPSGWLSANLSTSTDSVVSGRDGQGYMIQGNPSTAKHLYQKVDISGKAGDTYVIGAWLKATPVPINNLTNSSVPRNFGVQIRFIAEDGTQDNYMFSAEDKAYGWQYLAGTYTAKADFARIEYRLVYSKQCNSCIFDDLQLYKEEFGTRYEYDDNGRVTSATDSQNRKTTYTYVNDTRSEVSKITYADGTESTFTYDETTWRLLSSTDANGKVTTYSYDADGNATCISMNADSLTMTSGLNEYSGGYLVSSTDALGNTATYSYDTTKGLLLSGSDAAGTATNYTYDSANDALLKVESSGSEVDYTYSQGRLSTISHNTDSEDANNVVYSFEYDEFGNTTAVKVGTQPLITHTYAPNNGLRTQSTYGNGDYYAPTYDALDRVTAMSYNGVKEYAWSYGADGRVGLHNDLVNNVTWRYEYSQNGELTTASGSNGERFAYAYDTATGKLISATVTAGGERRVTTYNYSDKTSEEDKNLLESITLTGGATVEYEYDGFYRASSNIDVGGTDILTTDYTFKSGSAGNSTTTVIDSMTNAGNGWSSTYSYTYDSKGNIQTVRENGTELARYYYDSLNQLVREDNAQLGKTVVYTYDKGGNILEKSQYALTSASDLSAVTPSDIVAYGYTDANWKDKLTSYDGNAITYDEIGNPIQYYNGYTFDWQHGRQLASLSRNGAVYSQYTYNADGIRTRKTRGNETIDYTLEGDKVVYQTNGSYDMWYFYDATGSAIGFQYNGTPYYYIKNQQGDIVAIANKSGARVVEYVYDSWGKVTISGSKAYIFAAVNIFTYRGYIYDIETGFYYLGSRYYDPNTGRFLNADGYTTTGQGHIGNNMFAYCLNNPVSYQDDNGKMAAAFDLLNTWIFGDGSTQYYDRTSSIGKALIKSKKMQTYIDNAISAYRKNGVTDLKFYTNEFTSAEDGNELYLSTQHFKYQIAVTSQTRTVLSRGKKKRQVRYIANVTVNDTYDFDLKTWDGVGNSLNNMAFYINQMGVGTDYEWFATYTYKTEWE